MSEPFIGEVAMCAFDFPPRGWAFCDGQLLSISSHSALFSLLGTQYGGDGVSTFALPDLRGRVPVHAGQGPGLGNIPIGMEGGSEAVQLTADNLPAHSHPFQLRCASGEAEEASPTGNYHAMSTEDVVTYTPDGNATELMGQQNTAANATNSTGVPVHQPFTAIRFIIALQGVFPSQN